MKSPIFSIWIFWQRLPPTQGNYEIQLHIFFKVLIFSFFKFVGVNYKGIEIIVFPGLKIICKILFKNKIKELSGLWKKKIIKTKRKCFIFHF